MEAKRRRLVASDSPSSSPSPSRPEGPTEGATRAVATPTPPQILLPEDVLALVFGYCDVVDLVAVRRTGVAFRRAAAVTLARAESLHLSFLGAPRGRDPRSSRGCGSGAGQECLVVALLGDAVGRFPTNIDPTAENDARPSHLRRLELCGLRHVTGSAARYDWLGGILTKATRLQTLDLGGCTRLDPVTLRLALLALNRDNDGRSSCSLVHLNLSGCRRVDSETINLIARKLPKLETLNLAGCSSRRVRDDSVIHIFSNLHRLRRLDLSGLTGLTSDWLATTVVTRLPPQLEYLGMTGCKGVRLFPLEAVGSIMKRWLRRIDVIGDQPLDFEAGANDGGGVDGRIATISSAIGENRVESVAGVLGITTESLRSVWPWSGDATASWANLRVVRFDFGTPRSGDMPRGGLPGGALGLIACRAAGKLREVHVGGCEGVCDEDVRLLAATCASSLNCLDMTGCTGITDGALEALGAGCCTRLTELNVSACFRVGNSGVMALCPLVSEVARGCPSLKALKIASTDVTDSIILAIGGLYRASDGNALPFGPSCKYGLQKLLLLDVRDCKRLSSMAVSWLRSQSKSLIELDARGVQGRPQPYKRPPPRGLVPISNGVRNASILETRNAIADKIGSNDGGTSINPLGRHSCTVTQFSQRLKARQGIEPERMFHCEDCELVPSTNRGICAACAVTCHRGHRTYLGSLARFYCDCAFGHSSNGTECKLVSPLHEASDTQQLALAR